MKGSQTGTCIAETRWGAIESPENDRITDQLVEHGAHTGSELTLLLDLVGPGDVVVDVGAHVGTFTIPLSMAAGEAGHVVAIEAWLPHLDLLQANVDRVDPPARVEILHAAAAEAKTSYSAHSNPGNTGATYLEEVEGQPDPHVGPALLLDEWIAEHPDLGVGDVDLLKVDVEGMEPSVLASARQILQVSKPVLHLEVHRTALSRQGYDLAGLSSILEDAGYHLFTNLAPRLTPDVYEVGRLPSLGWGGSFLDVLAVHPSDPRYPEDALGPHRTAARRTGRRFLNGLRRLVA